MKKSFLFLLMVGLMAVGWQASVQAAEQIDLSVDKLHVANTPRPTLVGKAAPASQVVLDFEGAASFAVEASTGQDGWFALTSANLPQDLTDGAYTVSYDGKKVNLVVQTGQVLGSNTENLIAQADLGTPTRAFGSANPVTATPRPTPTPVATPVPTPTPTPVPTVLPTPVSTSAAVPVSGNVANTAVLAVIGLVLLGFSGYSLVKVQNKRG